MSSSEKLYDLIKAHFKDIAPVLAFLKSCSDEEAAEEISSERYEMVALSSAVIFTFLDVSSATISGIMPLKKNCLMLSAWLLRHNREADVDDGEQEQRTSVLIR
jgi:hypothetical protein